MLALIPGRFIDFPDLFVLCQGRPAADNVAIRTNESRAALFFAWSPF
jgi:hypothetical protein